MLFTDEEIQKLKNLGKEYAKLKPGKDSLLRIIFESELPESVYNSNAIENSTLTIKETEKVLLELEIARQISIREVFEARNLARVFEYLKTKDKKISLDKELILFLHKMLISGIDDSIAGRFRNENEFVRVGSHIAAAPEQIDDLITNALANYNSSFDIHPVERIAEFHLEFERIHPFNDGNGRIGRVLINYQLMQLGLPPIIIRNKEKAAYYEAFSRYENDGSINNMSSIVYLALLESLNKRITYLNGKNIVRVAEYAKTHKDSTSNLLNKAKRQTIPAFRERGVWKIGV